MQLKRIEDHCKQQILNGIEMHNDCSAKDSYMCGAYSGAIGAFKDMRQLIDTIREETFYDLNSKLPLSPEMLKEAREAGYEACYAQSKLIIKDLLSIMTREQLESVEVSDANFWLSEK